MILRLRSYAERRMDALKIETFYIRASTRKLYKEVFYKRSTDYTTLILTVYIAV